VCWRFCKYTPGGHFGPHYDGPYIVNDNERSLQTLNLYLNGDFSGGSTNFVKESQSMLPGTNGKFYADQENITLRIVPEIGLALLFNHHMLHEGQALESNVKYLMRSDIMYRRKDPPVMGTKEIQGMELLKQAQQKEQEKSFDEAAQLYRRAYRLWPPLELHS